MVRAWPLVSLGVAACTGSAAAIAALIKRTFGFMAVPFVGSPALKRPAKVFGVNVAAIPLESGDIEKIRACIHEEHLHILRFQFR
jgi:hypothetical protein